MHVFWHAIIRPILDIIRPKTIVEIGTWNGDTTVLLAQFCAEHHAVVHAIDPQPTDEMEERIKAYPDHLIFHRDLSLNVLGHLPSPDAVLIDGDHNWYTVYHELLLLERRAKEGGAFPVVFLHDTAWPYGYRDRYANPERIPAQYLQPHAQGGISLTYGQPELERGFQQDAIHALTENGARNGVRSAVDEFMQQTDLQLEVVHLPGLFGLSILLPSALRERYPELAAYVRNMTLNPLLRTHLEAVERHRLELLAQREEVDRDYATQKDIYKARITELNERVQQLLQTDRKLREHNESLRKREAALKEKYEQEVQTLARMREEENAHQAALREEQRKHLTRMQVQLREARTDVVKLREETNSGDREPATQTQSVVVLSSPPTSSGPSDEKVQALQAELKRVYATRSWRWTAWMRRADARRLTMVSRDTPYRLFDRLKRIWTGMGEPFPGFVRLIRHSALARWPAQPQEQRPAPIAYHAQLLSPPTHLPQTRRAESVKRATNLPFMPHIGIVIDVDIVDEILLRRALNSVTEQTYDAWSVIVACMSADAADVVQNIVADYSQLYPNTFRLLSPRNTGDEDVRNAALRQSAGMYVCPLRSTDTLQPDALEKFISGGLNAALWPDLLYSDHDELPIERKQAYEPVYKPAWSPELLLSYNYIGTTFLAKRELVLQLLNPSPLEGNAFTYDLLLRIAETDPSVEQVTHVLYHHHAPPLPTKKEADQELNALQTALSRRGLPHRAERHPLAEKNNALFFRLRYDVPSAETAPKVCIIIPTKDHVDLLDQCLQAIKRHTRYPRYEIIIIDSNSTEPATQRYLSGLPHTVIRIETDPFSFSYINNRAVEQTDAPFVLLLNNDAIPQHDEWLTEMMGVMALDERIGVVGAKLLYPPGRQFAVQSLGMIVGRHWASLIKFRTKDELGYGAYNQVMRNVSANGGACQLTRRSLYERVHGLDEEEFAVDFSDVDYCLKVLQLGYRVVVTPQAVLLHHESYTRGNNNGKGASVSTSEYKAFERKWGHLFGHDPYYHPRFSLHLHDDAFTPTKEGY